MGLDWLSFAFSEIFAMSSRAAVLIVLVLAAQTLGGRWLGPEWRYRLWLLVLVRLMLPVSIESRLSVFNYVRPDGLRFVWVRPAPALGVTAHNTIVTRPGFEAGSTTVQHDLLPVGIRPSVTVTPQTRTRWTAYFIGALVWLLGVAALGGRLVWTSRRLGARIGRVLPKTDLDLLRLVRKCQEAVGTRSSICLIETPAVRTPALWGFSVPRLLVPSGFFARFDLGALRFILLHELYHVRRRDIAVNWLAALLQVVYWFNPLVWIAFARMRVERELACDARVLGHLGSGEAREYGATILKLLERPVGPTAAPTLVGVLENGRQLKRRIRLISNFEPRAGRQRWVAVSAASALALVGLTDPGEQRPAFGGPRPQFSDRAPAGLLVLDVRDAETGLPIVGARVNDKWVTGEDGRCAIPGSPPLFLRVTASGHVPAMIEQSALADAQEPRVVSLDRGICGGGAVHDAEGRPVAGARVTVLEPGSESGFHIKIPVETGPDGRWSTSEIPAGRDQLGVRVVHPDFVEKLFSTGVVGQWPGTREKPARVNLDDLRAERALLVIGRGITIEGAVRDLAGDPIEGAEVRQGYSWGIGPYGETRTGADGRFKFGNGVQGKLTLTVLAHGFAPQLRTFDVFPGMGPIEFYLARGRIVRGVVVGESERPIAGATISGSDPFDWRTTTDSEGRFVWDSAPTKPAAVNVTAEGYAVARVMLEPAGPDTRITLRRLRAFEVRGTVRDADTGSPIPGFEVRVSTARTPLGKFVEHRPAVSGHHGSFVLGLQDRIESYGLEIRADGYVPDRSCWVQSARGNASVVVALRKGLALRGVVLSPDGRPAARAQILSSAERPVEMIVPGRFRADAGNSPRGSETNGSGQFSVALEPDSRVIVVAHNEGYAISTPGSTDSSGSIRLERWGRLEGTLRVGASPMAGETVSLSGTSGFLRVAISVLTDAAGRFSFERVPGGAYEIARRIELDQAVGRLTQTQYLVIRAGERSVVELGGQGSPVIGKIVFVARSPQIAWNTFLHLLESLDSGPSARRYAVEFDRSGGYRIEDVPAGHYRLTLRIPGMPDNIYTREVVVPEVPGGRSDTPVNLGTLTLR